MTEKQHIPTGERAEFENWVRRDWPDAPLRFIRDALPVDDPRYGQYCDDALQRAWVGWQARAALVPSSATDLERPEVMAVLVLGGVFDGREFGDNDIVTVNPAIERLQAALVTDGEVLVELMTVAQYERMTQKLRYKAELYDEVWEMVTGKGYMNVTTAIAKLEQERDAAQARVPELEKQEPVAEIVQREPFEDGSRNPCKTIEWAGQNAADDFPVGAKLYASPVAQAGQVPQAWIDVQAERRRQIEAEGWVPEHDDEHDGGELAAAGAAYALHAADQLNPYSQGDGGDEAPIFWPWHDGIAGRGEGPEKTKPAWWKPTTARRDLVKACALALAEIERLDRAAAPAQGGSDHA